MNSPEKRSPSKIRSPERIDLIHAILRMHQRHRFDTIIEEIESLDAALRKGRDAVIDLLYLSQINLAANPFIGPTDVDEWRKRQTDDDVYQFISRSFNKIYINFESYRAGTLGLRWIRINILTNVPDISDLTKQEIPTQACNDPRNSYTHSGIGQLLVLLETPFSVILELNNPVRKNTPMVLRVRGRPTLIEPLLRKFFSKQKEFIIGPSSHAEPYYRSIAKLLAPKISRGLNHDLKTESLRKEIAHLCVRVKTDQYWVLRLKSVAIIPPT